jgi:hypothetical protein
VPVSLVCINGLRFACGIESAPGKVVLFDLSCALRWPLSKAKSAPKVEAMYRAKALQVVSTGHAIPLSLARSGQPNVVLFTANDNVAHHADGDGKASLRSLNFDTHALATVAAGFQSAFGVARFKSVWLVSDPKGNQIWQVSADGNKSPFIGCGRQGLADGLALEAELAVPLGIAVSGSTVFFIQSDCRLRMFSFTRQLCKFMASTREFGELFGILDPRVRKNVRMRAQLRTTDFKHKLDTLQNIILDREDWYKEARLSLGLPAESKGLKGPEGVPCFGTFQAWQASADDLLEVHTRLEAAGLRDLAEHVPLDKANTMPVEHEFGNVGLGFNHMETQETFPPLLNKGRVETIVSTCSVGFSHCTSSQPYVVCVCCCCLNAAAASTRRTRLFALFRLARQLQC